MTSYTVSYGHFGPEHGGALSSIVQPMSAYAGNAQRRQVTLYVWDGLSRLTRVQAGYCAYSAGSATGCSGSDVVSELVSRVHDGGE